MFKHNFLLAYRNFKRFKSSFFINLIGLSSGMACVLLIYLWVNDELQMDKFHQNDSRLYRAMEHQQYAEEVMTTWSTPGVLSEALSEEIPEVEYAVGVSWVNNYTLSIGEKSVKADGFHVGEDFFNIFSYGLVEGDPNQVLADKNSIVISRDLAIQLFDADQDLIGRAVEFQHEKEFLISGVFEGTPGNSTYQFDFVMTFREFLDNNEWATNWGNNGPETFVTLNEGSDLKEVNEKLTDFIKDKNEESNVTLFLAKNSDLYLYGRYENGIQSGGRIEYVRLFSIIAFFILAIACINFMNLSTARASRRSKEVGIKKAVGARRGSLIGQFLSESLLITFLSLLVATLVVWLFLPLFNQMTGKEISLRFDDTSIISWIIGIGLFTGFIAGSYPALYLSGFKPVAILKGEIKGSIGELWARKGLVIFQFTLSVILIVAVLVIFKQIQYVQTKNLGFDKDNVIYFSNEGRIEENTATFISEIKSIPGVLNASSVGHDMIGRQNNTSGLNWEGKNPDDEILFENIRSNYDLIETLGIEMVEGRSFSRDFSTDTTKIIFNEAAIKVMGLKGDPIGQVVRLWDQYDLEIIGVTRDFHFQSLHTNVNPLFFRLTPDYNWNIMVKIEAGKEKETLEGLSAFCEDFNPGFAFDYQFLDEEYQRQYAAEQRVADLSKYFAGIAILISCLGLFGLAAFTAERRLKEIGIRKALGSSSLRILYLLTSDFTKLVIVSILLGLPASYMLVNIWLERFAFRIDLEAGFFIGAGLIALVIAWLTVGGHALKAANINPARCLRDE